MEIIVAGGFMTQRSPETQWTGIRADLILNLTELHTDLMLCLLLLFNLASAGFHCASLHEH